MELMSGLWVRLFFLAFNLETISLTRAHKPAQKEDVGFGINRLNIGVIIKDDEVDWEDIKELVLSNTRDLIQSVDLLGIHKAKIVNE